MDDAKLQELVPKVEASIRSLRPHAIVLGLGPSVRVMPLVDPGLLKGVRLFGVNDIWRYLPVQEVVIMDPAVKALDPSGDRFKHIVQATPDRFWIYSGSMHSWRRHLSPEQLSKTECLNLRLLDYSKRVFPGGEPKLTGYPYNHIVSSPCGTTAVAWGEGMRRIGVIGVDMIPGQASICKAAPMVAWFFHEISKQALALHGEIRNLSPISYIRRAFVCSESSSVPTSA